MVHIISKKCLECSNRPPSYSCLQCGEDICISCISQHEETEQERAEEYEKKQRRDTRNDSGV